MLDVYVRPKSRVDVVQMKQVAAVRGKKNDQDELTKLLSEMIRKIGRRRKNGIVIAIIAITAFTLAAV
jgi:hypothetical protein